MGSQIKREEKAFQETVYASYPLFIRTMVIDTRLFDTDCKIQQETALTITESR